MERESMENIEKLSDLRKFKKIVIQCHDNPDADTVACGYAVWWYLKRFRRKSRLIYGGRNQITKPNMIHMINDLDIPLEYVKELGYEPDLIIMVDCSVRSNASYFPAKQYAIIDHHSSYTQDYPICYKRIEPRYKACASLVAQLIWEDDNYTWYRDINGYMTQWKISYNDDRSVSTALYYGLFKDSVEFTELLEPEDENLRRYAKIDRSLFNKLRYSNLSVQELGVIGEALHHAHCSSADKFATAMTSTTDRNILGIVSDYLIQVDDIEASVAYYKNGEDIRVSVRTCSEYIAAEEIAKILTKGIGGGHRDKAAGPILDPIIRKYDPNELQSYINRGISDYFHSFDILDISGDEFDVSGLPVYERIPQDFGYADIYGDVFQLGTTLWIQEVGGRKRVPVAHNTILVFSNRGHVEVLDRVVFDGMYQDSKKRFVLENPEMFSGVISDDKKNGNFPLPKFKRCRSRKNVVYAKQIEKATKVVTRFADRYEFHYQFMDAGDYLVIDTEDTKQRILDVGEKKAFEVLEKWHFAHPDWSYIETANREYIRVYPMKKADFESEYQLIG